jgi:Mg-chelatase subunit ChlD
MVKLPPWIIKVSKAKDEAQLFMKYLGAYLEGVPTTFDERVPTMAVDHLGRLYINPTWCQQFSDEQNGYVLLHEMSHNLLGHAERRAEMIPKPNEQQLLAWNIAADLCVQQILMPLDKHRPDGTVNIDEWQERIPGLLPGMATEKYYGMIYQDMTQPKPKPQPTPGDEGEDDDGESGGAGDDGDDGDESEDVSAGPPSNKPGKTPHTQGGSSSDGIPKEYELADDFAAAGANLSRLEEVKQAMDADPTIGRGRGAGAIRQQIEARLVKQPDPFDKLRGVVGRATSSPIGIPEPTYRRRNRRQECDDLPLRSEIRMNPECVIIVDTSGSMGSGNGPRVQRALTAVAQGLNRVKRPRVIAWDDGLQSNAQIATLRSFAWQGGGGTDMAEAVTMADRTYRPDAIVLITDGGTDWPEKTRARFIVALVGHDGVPPAWATTVDLTKEKPAHVG